MAGVQNMEPDHVLTAPSICLGSNLIRVRGTWKSSYSPGKAGRPHVKNHKFTRKNLSA